MLEFQADDSPIEAPPFTRIHGTNYWATAALLIFFG